jgi:hypothetical protein
MCSFRDGLIHRMGHVEDAVSVRMNVLGLQFREEVVRNLDEKSRQQRHGRSPMVWIGLRPAFVAHVVNWLVFLPIDRGKGIHSANETS